jgi:hypothetical protein
MLWMLLTLISSFTLIGSAVSSAIHSTTGFWGIAFAFCVGAALAALNFWFITYRLSDAVDDRLRRCSDRTQTRLIRALFFVALLWCIAARLVGAVITETAMRLVGW